MSLFKKPRWRHYKNGARQYRPRSTGQNYDRRDRAFDAKVYIKSSNADYICQKDDIFDCAEARVRGTFGSHLSDRHDDIIDSAKRKFDSTHQAQDGLIALFMQAPGAVLAQRQMDKHRGGYRNKQERLFELIDFNDTFDSTVLAMNSPDRLAFARKAKSAIDRICKQVGVPSFDLEQWGAIVRGLSREIAVYEAARDNGLEVVMAPRSQDAIGIDLQVRDPESHRYVNIDIKTPSSFRSRLNQLLREGRVSEGGLLEADNKGYVITKNGHGNNQVEVITLCILPDRVGEINNFKFDDTTKIRDVILGLIYRHGLNDGQFGIIPSNG